MEEDPYQSILEIDPAKKKEDPAAAALKAEVGRLTAELTKARSAVVGLQVKLVLVDHYFGETVSLIWLQEKEETLKEALEKERRKKKAVNISESLR